MLEVMSVTQPKQHTFKLNPQSTIQEFLWTYIYIYTYIQTGSKNSGAHAARLFADR